MYITVGFILVPPVDYAINAIYLYNKLMVETNDSDDVMSVDRVRTLTASTPQAIWRTDSRYRVNFDHGDIWWTDPSLRVAPSNMVLVGQALPIRPTGIRSNVSVLHFLKLRLSLRRSKAKVPLRLNVHK